MPSFLSFLALLSACYTLLTFASPLEARQAVVPIVTVQTVTVTPSPSNAVTSSTTTKPTTAITGSVEPMSGPGASSNGQTGTGAGADASTYTTLDGAGNTFVEVYPSSMVTITASVSTTASVGDLSPRARWLAGFAWAGAGIAWMCADVFPDD
ncbi:hypothetical protein LTR48_007814 [Friedmanniomyces endolithicus]|uniref:Transmembrane protein n=1 Tax=Rachicladosporium monterosium TaxID=1507873 RepID=A0ABR0KV24_9PEZI|nr:hypothetical protein LTS09_002880 [Friedmanniomyces endolithicus]KAK0931729.1 hypothetical protein LTR29_016206 [Friedmanniomyces endolithicus]KAK1080319.1 hypothetical protein LTR48_007814 [Friedmanniomyces endolithicus]KAK1821203.1 hypothetical protein LTR12_004429 [Friedmanniomyces endolithicus]KAK5138626.1 hypothetical protein LTR32_007827 [Rachicladosporium monterosium]